MGLSVPCATRADQAMLGGGGGGAPCVSLQHDTKTYEAYRTHSDEAAHLACAGGSY